MNYELAKELKDAGFPGIKFCNTPFHDSPGCTVDECGEELPSLSELIEALDWEKGYQKFVLESARDPIEWMAWLLSKHDKPDAVGATPEEAVARLWLALNKK